MRSIVVKFAGGCLLGLIAGCGGSNKVEIPAHPAPPPEHPVLMSANGGAAAPASPATTPAKPPPPPPASAHP